MKKTYQKPEIMFEDFSLSVNIAGDCESIVGNPTEGTCGVLTSSGDTIFINEETDCVFTPVDMGGTEDDKLDGFCYHVPIESHSLFNS